MNLFCEWFHWLGTDFFLFVFKVSFLGNHCFLFCFLHRSAGTELINWHFIPLLHCYCRVILFHCSLFYFPRRLLLRVWTKCVDFTAVGGIICYCLFSEFILMCSLGYNLLIHNILLLQVFFIATVLICTVLFAFCVRMNVVLYNIL